MIILNINSYSIYKGSDIINCRVLEKRKCEITNDYSNNHLALDLVGENYTLDKVISHSAGTVIEVQDGYDNLKDSTGLLSYGNYIKIDHGNGFKTLYAHLKKNLPIKVGSTVNEGTYLGNMSNSGNAYGSHLHFEVYHNNTRINPTKYLDNSFSSEEPNNLKYQLGQTVKINGVYISSTSPNKLTPAVNVGTITRIITNAPNPYLLNNGAIGWVNDQCIQEENSQEYLQNSSYSGFSIVDALKEINVDSSYSYRSELAKLNDIENYTGTGIQNTNLLNLLKKGQLRYK